MDITQCSEAGGVPAAGGPNSTAGEKNPAMPAEVCNDDRQLALYVT